MIQEQRQPQCQWSRCSLLCLKHSCWRRWHLFSLHKSFRPAAWQPSSCPKQRCAVEKLEKKKAWNLTPLGDESNAPEPWPAPASHPLGRDTQRTREEQGTETGIRCAVDIQSMTRCTIVRALLINLCLCLDNFVISMFSVFLTPALVHSMLRASD